MKNIIPVLLFCFGLVLEGSGFFISNLDVYPNLKRILAHEGTSAHKAMESLEEGYIIDEKTPGFIDFRNIFWDYLRNLSLTPRPVEKIFYLIRIEPAKPREKQGSLISDAIFKSDEPFYSSSVYMVYEGIGIPELTTKSAPKPVTKRIVSLSHLIKIVNNSIRHESHQVAVIIFIIGIILQIIGFIFNKQSHRK